MFALALLLFAQHPPPAPDLAVEVTGAHMPAAGLMVGLACADDVVRFATTDARGRVTFTDLPPAIAYEAFVPGVRARGATGTSFGLGAAGQREAPSITLTVEPGCALRVVVVDADGKPVAGAQVESNGGSQTGRPWAPLGRTDAQGVLRMPVHSDGGQFRAWASGHVPSTFVGADLARDRETEVRLRLRGKARAVSGRVLDLAGEPIPHAEIACAQFFDSVVIPEFTRAAADGTFVIDWLAEGHVALVARDPRGREPHRAHVRFDVGAELLPALDLRVASGASLGGIAPAPDARTGAATRVTALFKPDAVYELPFLRQTADADANGNYALRGLTPGRWKVTARFGEAEVERTFHLRDGEIATWDPAPPKTAVLRIALRDPRGRPLPGWRIGLRNEFGFPSGASTVTDADGVTANAELFWRLRADRPVTVTLRAPLAPEDGDDGFDPFPTLVVPGLVPDDRAQEIVVPDAARPRHRLRGRVRRVDGAAVTGAKIEVSAARTRSESVSVAVDADGAFASGPLSPGRYELSVQVPGSGTVTVDDLPLGGSNDLDLGDVLVGAVSAVHVVVEGDAPSDLRLWLGTATGGRNHRLTRAADGTFIASAIAPGRYVVRGLAAQEFVTPTPITVGDAKASPRARVTCTRTPTLHVVVALPVDGDRSQTGWSGDLAVRDPKGTVVVSAPLRHAFVGRWREEIHFDVGLPAGEYHVQIETWDRQRLHTTATVGTEGGSARLTPK